MSCYLLFRSRSGKAFFKDPRFGVIGGGGMTRFDGVAAGQVPPTENGFLARDVARNSDYVAIGNEALGLKLRVRAQRVGGVIYYDVTLDDLTGKDRAVTLAYTIALQGQAALTLTSLAANGIWRELLTGQAVVWKDKRVEIELDPGDVRVIEGN